MIVRYGGRPSAYALGLAVITSLLAPAPAGAAGAKELILAPYSARDGELAPGSVGIGDVTGDGRADVVMTSTYTEDRRAWSLWVYAQKADGDLAAPRRLATSGGYYSDMPLGVADLDGDGDADVAVGSTGGVDIFLQGPNGLALDRTWSESWVGDLVTADLDGDGTAEVVALGGGGVQVLRRGVVGYTAEPVGVEGAEVEVSDVTGDGRPDVVVVDRTEITVSRQLEGGSFADPVRYPLGVADTSINGLATGDVNGDAKADVVVSAGGNGPSAKVVTRLQRPDGTLGPPRALRSYDIPEAITVADVSGDGLGDVITLHGGWSAMGVYRQKGGLLTAEQRSDIPGLSHYDTKSIAVGDISGDGRPDIALASAGLVVFRTRLPYADLRLGTDDRSIGYGAKVTATIMLRGAEGRKVSLLADSGSSRRTIATGMVNSSGVLRVPVRLTRNTRLVASYAGDDSVGPTEASVPVAVAARLTPSAGNSYGRAGRHHLVHHQKDPVLRVRLSTPDDHRCIAFDYQGRDGRRWFPAGGVRCVKTDDRGRAGLRLTGVPQGRDVRMRARFKGSPVNGASRTAWVYFRVTR